MKITRKVKAPLQSEQESLGIEALVLRVSYVVQSHRWFVLSQSLHAEEECSPQGPELGCAEHCSWGSYISIEVFGKERWTWVLASTKPFRCRYHPREIGMDLKPPLSLSPPFCCSKLPCEEGCHLLWMPKHSSAKAFWGWMLCILQSLCCRRNAEILPFSLQACSLLPLWLMACKLNTQIHQGWGLVSDYCNCLLRLCCFSATAWRGSQQCENQIEQFVGHSSETWVWHLGY